MTTRRNFLTRSGLALGALLVGDEVLEALDRLTHKKVWTGADFALPHYGPRLEEWTHRVTATEIIASQEAMRAYYAKRWAGIAEEMLRARFSPLLPHRTSV